MHYARTWGLIIGFHRWQRCGGKRLYIMYCGKFNQHPDHVTRIQICTLHYTRKLIPLYIHRHTDGNALCAPMWSTQSPKSFFLPNIFYEKRIENQIVKLRIELTFLFNPSKTCVDNLLDLLEVGGCVLMRVKFDIQTILRYPCVDNNKMCCSKFRINTSSLNLVFIHIFSEYIEHARAANLSCSNWNFRFSKIH